MRSILRDGEYDQITVVDPLNTDKIDPFGAEEVSKVIFRKGINYDIRLYERFKG